MFASNVLWTDYDKQKQKATPQIKYYKDISICECVLIHLWYYNAKEF